MLNTGSENTLIGGGFMRNLELNKKRKLANVSSIKDTGDAIHTKEVELQVMDNSNKSRFTIKEALTIESEKFNMSSQHM